MKYDRPIVVSGVSSFVGAHLAHYLAEKGMRVVAGHSRSLNNYSGIQAGRLAFAKKAGVEFVPFDLLEPQTIVDAIHELRPAYWISHAGWTQDYANENYDIEHAHAIHVSPFDAIFAALRAVGCRGAINTGSSAEYGNDRNEWSEDDPAWPASAYGLSKLSKTIRFRQLSHLHGVPVRVARLFIPFGVLDSPSKLIASVTNALLAGRSIDVTDGEIERDFLGIRDICRGYLALVHDFERDSMFDIFNLSQGRPTSLSTLLNSLARYLDADPSLICYGARPSRRFEPLILFGRNEKARTTLAWQPTELDEAIREYAAAERQRKALSTPADPVNLPLVRLSRSSIQSDAITQVSCVLRRGFLGMGKEVDAFERELSAYIGGENRHVICVNTGTSALHLALQACGIGPGDEVLVPTLTYIASFQAISATGATPVACDVRESDGLLDLVDAARRITPRTRAVMPVHYASNPALLTDVYEFAQRHGLRVIEDAAHAFGCRWNGQRIGATGDLVCFSFDGIKNITCGEGGAVITGDPDAAERIRNARLLGVLKDTEKRYTGQRSWDFDVTEQGWRYHMSNPNAALGRSQLHSLNTRFAPRRIELGVNYHELLGDIPNLRMLPIEYGDIIPHIFPIFVPAEKRDTLRETLRAANIETGIHYKPNHLLNLYGGGSANLPVAEKLYSQMLSIPLHAELSKAEQQRVVETIKTALT